MYVQENPSTKTRSIGSIAAGLGLLVASAAIAMIGVLQIMSIAYRNLNLGYWPWYVIALGVALVGVALIIFSDRNRCGQCGGIWENLEAYFPLETEQTVMGALSNGSVDVLTQLPWAPKNSAKMHLNISGCEKCQNTGSIDVIKWQSSAPETVMEERWIVGPAVKTLIEVGKKHEDARGEND